MSSFFDFKKSYNENTEFIIFGIPWDSLSSLENVDSALAPTKIREKSYDLARITELGFDISKINASDVGNVEIDPSNPEINIRKIEEFIKKIYNPYKSRKIVMIGGDHFCTYPVVKAIGDLVLEKEKFGILIFDAHADFYDIWEGEKNSHTTVIHRIFELNYINSNNLFIVGTRDIDNIELDDMKEVNLGYLSAYNVDELGVKGTINRISDFFTYPEPISKLYVSIDIDVLDPSIAPGTGYAIPGGLSYRVLWKILKQISHEFDIIGFDLVEVSPGLDLPNKITQICAAKLIVEFMSFMKK